VTTLDLFKLLCPDAAAGQADDRITDFIQAAAQRLDAVAFGGLFDQATVYLAAHLLFRSPLGGTPGGAGVDGAGAVTSKKAGDLSIGFGASAGGGAGMPIAHTDVDLMQTHYGRQFIAIRDTRSAGVPYIAEIF
jgi:hypothetical protein